MSYIKFAKIKENAIIPSKRREDAGYDIYCNLSADELIILEPHATKAFPTGIASAFSPELGIKLAERSSCGKKGIAIRAGLMDSGYRGEWLILLQNNNDKIVLFSKNEEKFNEFRKNNPSVDYITVDLNKAIAQAVIYELADDEVEEVSYDELKQIPSERGEGRFGSSGK